LGAVYGASIPQDYKNGPRTQLQRGPFRCAIWQNINNPRTWSPRDSFAWIADGTSNQFLVGEKNIYNSAVGQCRGVTPASDRSYVGDCSVFIAGDWGTVAPARSFNGHIARNSAIDKFNSSNELEGVSAESQELLGSTHPGICTFLLGDGSVRSVSVTIPTGGLAIGSSTSNGTYNSDSILAKMGNVNLRR
jgi:hypothetical protein